MLSPASHLVISSHTADTLAADSRCAPRPYYPCCPTLIVPCSPLADATSGTVDFDEFCAIFSARLYDADTDYEVSSSGGADCSRTARAHGYMLIIASGHMLICHAPPSLTRANAHVVASGNVQGARH